MPGPPHKPSCVIFPEGGVLSNPRPIEHCCGPTAEVQGQTAAWPWCPLPVSCPHTSFLGSGPPGTLWFLKWGGRLSLALGQTQPQDMPTRTAFTGEQERRPGWEAGGVLSRVTTPAWDPQLPPEMIPTTAQPPSVLMSNCAPPPQELGCRLPSSMPGPVPGLGSRSTPAPMLPSCCLPRKTP